MDAHACHPSFQVLSKAGSLSKQCANNDILSKKMKSEWLHVGDTGKHWGASRLFGVSVSISRELSWINCVIVHTETTYCDTHTGMYMHTYIAVITVFPRGISLLGGREEGCCNITSFLFSSSFLSTFIFLQLMHIQEFVSPLFSNYSASWLTLSLLCPSALPIPSGYLFFTVADIFRVWQAVKSLWRSMCAARLSEVSHGMMESLAYLSYSSSCFAICLMYSRPFGIQPIFHRWADCCKTLTHSLSPHDLAVHRTINRHILTRA